MRDAAIKAKRNYVTDRNGHFHRDVIIETQDTYARIIMEYGEINFKPIQARRVKYTDLTCCGNCKSMAHDTKDLSQNAKFSPYGIR